MAFRSRLLIVLGGTEGLAWCGTMAWMKMTAGTRRERSVRFASTRWSVVLLCAADQEAAAQGRGALEEFCQIYWVPVYASLLRRGLPAADAQDLTQSFFAHLLHRPSFAAVDPAKGKFRTFLLTALRNFLADHHDRQRTIKRGGEFRLLALSGMLVQTEPDAFIDPTEETSAANSLDRVFDQQWAVALAKRALLRLGEELVEEGKGKIFAALQPLLGLGEQPLSKQEKVAQDLRMPLATLRTHLHRLRLRFRSILRAEVACTVDRPEEVEAELHHLFQILLDR